MKRRKIQEVSKRVRNHLPHIETLQSLDLAMCNRFYAIVLIVTAIFSWCNCLRKVFFKAMIDIRRKWRCFERFTTEA